MTVTTKLEDIENAYRTGSEEVRQTLLTLYPELSARRIYPNLSIIGDSSRIINSKNIDDIIKALSVNIWIGKGLAPVDTLRDKCVVIRPEPHVNTELYINESLYQTDRRIESIAFTTYRNL